LQSPLDEREVDLKSAHNIEHVKEKDEGSSLDIRLKKCEQFQNLVELSEETISGTWTTETLEHPSGTWTTKTF
jgi:hypothetical protein